VRTDEILHRFHEEANKPLAFKVTASAPEFTSIMKFKYSSAVKKKGNTMFHIGGCPHTANIKVNKNRIQSKCYPPTVSVLFLNFLKTGSQLR
jgi:hypothetical protein